MLFLRKIYIYRAPGSGEESTPAPLSSQPTIARATTAPNLPTTGGDSLLLRRRANRTSTTDGLPTATPAASINILPALHIPDRRLDLAPDNPSPSPAPAVRSADNLSSSPEVRSENNTKASGGR
jgi:hypothetical protein